MNLLTIDDITEIAKLSRDHVRNRLVKTAGFPPPAPGFGPRKPRWYEDDVKRFFMGKPAQSSHKRGKPA